MLTCITCILILKSKLDYGYSRLTLNSSKQGAGLMAQKHPGGFVVSFCVICSLELDLNVWVVVEWGYCIDKLVWIWLNCLVKAAN